MPRIVRSGQNVEIHFTRLSKPAGVEGGFEISTDPDNPSSWRVAIEDRDYQVISVVENGLEDTVKLRLDTRNETAFYRFFIQQAK